MKKRTIVFLLCLAMVLSGTGVLAIDGGESQIPEDIMSGAEEAAALSEADVQPIDGDDSQIPADIADALNVARARAIVVMEAEIAADSGEREHDKENEELPEKTECQQCMIGAPELYNKTAYDENLSADGCMNNLPGCRDALEIIYSINAYTCLNCGYESHAVYISTVTRTCSGLM